MIKITSFQVSGFRSLKDIEIPDLNNPAIVFHGPNNSGKSNILLALSVIFSSKSRSESPEAPERTTPFWFGSIKNFSDNFYMGMETQIEFSLDLELWPAVFDGCLSKEIKNEVYVKGGHYLVNLTGMIVQEGSSGEMMLQSFTINGNSAYRKTSEGEPEWFPELEGVDEDVRKKEAESALSKFNDLVSLVPANRYLTAEKNESEIADDALSSENFKSWLHSLSLSRENYEVFIRICEWFDESPFELGEISFLQENGEIELMIEDKCGFRMPIASKGSGVQQMLVLLGYIASLRTPIICIEEPELNLSSQNQNVLISKLVSLVTNNEFLSSQILITSHSDQIGSNKHLKRFHVDNPDGRQTLVRRLTPDDRAALFPRID